MGSLYKRFRWLGRPQLFVGFIVICLCMGAVEGNLQGGHPPLVAAAEEQSSALPGKDGAESGLPMVASPVPSEPVDCAIVACIALTFDDGPDPAKTPQILDVLERTRIRATFFMVGKEVPGNEHLVQRTYYAGHEIGNHSWNHPDFTKLTPTAMQSQIASTQAAIAAADIPAPYLFRPPYGAVDNSVRAHVPMPMIRWDIDTEDWLTQDSAKITEHLLRDAHPGGIILMHDKYDATLNALEPALLALKQQYHFVTVSELLGLSPGDQGQYFNRVP